MNTMNISKRGQSGFTIIEALISLIIMGFGILSLSGMQMSLSRSADDAKQRTEAVRLAQEKIEFFRSYTGIATTLVAQGTALNWNALVDGTDTITTNATYNRSWTIGGGIGDPMRSLTVGVGWTNRAGQAQAVSLSSILSKTDPADSGFLGFPLPENTNLKRPKNRNLDIPIPAIDLGNGKSAVAFGPDKFVLFSNISGDVVQICTPTLASNPTTAQIIASLTGSETSNCTTINGFIVAGYVARDSSVSNSDWNAISTGLGIDHSGITRNAAGTTPITCQFGDATNQNTGATIADYKYYLCVISLTTPTPALTANGPYNWSGTILIAGPTVWHGANNKYFVCRYQYTATNFLTDTNQQNVQPYDKVNSSIDQQNYLIATTGNASSSANPACPGSMTVADVSTGVLHQDCRSASNSNHAADCPLLGTTPQYTITYAGNGNTSGIAPTDASSPYTSGSTITVLGNTGNLVKTGDSFVGWNTLANGTGTSYAAGAPLTITANTTLYAQWSANPTYSITYNDNGSTSGSAPADANSPYASGSTITVLGNTGNLTKTGYSFAGWNTAADGNGTTYTAGDAFTVPVGNTTLYAKWTFVTTYTVTYEGNGNTVGSAPTGTTYTSGATVSVLGNTGVLQRTGYSFSGWNTAALGGGTAYSPGATFTISGNTTLYAQWTAILYTVTYSGNNNTGGTAPSDASSPYTYLNTVTVKINTGALTRTGYTFSGWNTAANGSGTSYAEGATFAISTSTTLYAKWTAILYTVSFNTNGGSALTSQSVAYNTTATTPTTPTKTGSIFVGWYSDSDLTNAFLFTTPITGTTTLFAKWTTKLSTPNPQWSGNTLSWTGITGATAYSVRYCQVTNKNVLTACVPASPTSQTGLSVSSPTTLPSAVAKKNTRCYNVTATGSPYTSSDVSTTRCIYLNSSGSVYTTQ